MQTITITIVDGAAMVLFEEKGNFRRQHILNQAGADALYRSIDNQLLTIALDQSSQSLEVATQRTEAALAALVQAGVHVPGLSPEKSAESPDVPLENDTKPEKKTPRKPGGDQ